MKSLFIPVILSLFACTSDVSNKKQQPFSVHYFYNSGWMIETSKHVIVIDFIPHPSSKITIDSLKEKLVSANAAGKKIIVLVSHSHEDHFSEDIFQWAKKIPGIRYILGWNYSGQADKNLIHTMGTHDSLLSNDVTIYTHTANDDGVGFLLDIDGNIIYHGGDHALWLEQLRESFSDELKYIRSKTKRIDLAFLPAVKGMFTKCTYDSTMVAGLRISLDILQPATIALQHLGCEDKLDTYKKIYDELAPKYPGKKWIIPARYNEAIKVVEND